MPDRVQKDLRNVSSLCLVAAAVSTGLFGRVQRLVGALKDCQLTGN
jgi:hypothetical protein